MKNSDRAFTLIELLVVIAIIAILAAILFPVFAQAKIAAKKASALTQSKQQATSTAIYMTDSEDVYPLGWGTYSDGTSAYFSWQSVPADWLSASDPDTAYASRSDIINITEPYRKNLDLLEMPGMSNFRPPYAASFYGTRKLKKVGLAYNGDLHGFPASGVAAPSQLPMFTETEGNLNVEGFDTGPNPVLNCDTANAACIYTPVSSSDCAGFGNGTYDYYIYPNASQWVYGKSQIWVYADTSAKAKPIGMNIGGKTDFKTDPYTEYQANAVDSETGWFDQYYCHALLFRPDFDFQTWPTAPVEGY